MHVVELPDGPRSRHLPEGGRAPTPTASAWTRRPPAMEWLIRRARAPRTTRGRPAGKAAYLNALLPGAGRASRTRSSGRPGCPRVVERGRPGRRRPRARSCGGRSPRARRGRELGRGRTPPAPPPAAADRRLLPAEKLLLALLARRTRRASGSALDSCTRPDLRGPAVGARSCARPRAVAADGEPVTPRRPRRTRSSEERPADAARDRGRAAVPRRGGPGRLRARAARGAAEGAHGGDPEGPARAAGRTRRRCSRRSCSSSD